jgi:RecA-family ATPase
LPEWVSRLVKQSNITKHDSRDDSAVEELDQQKDINRAVAYLSVTAPIGGPGQHNSTLYKVACQLRDYGISSETAVTLITQFWNPRILTPRDDDELYNTTIHAYEYSRDMAGTASVTANGGMGPVPGYNPEENPHIPLTLDEFEKRYGETLETLPDGAAIPRREWLVENVVTKGFTTVVVAPGGVGKTTWAMQLAMALARGDGEFMNVKVNVPEGCRVWLYNGEDPRDELQRRAAAIIKGFNLTDLKRKGSKAGNFLYGSGVKNNLCLMDMAENGRYPKPIVTDEVDAMGEFIIKHDIKMVVIDPLVSAHGLDEQSNKAVDDLMKKVFGKLAERCDCAFVIVHHTRKGAAAGDIDSARGAGSLSAAARCAIMFSVMSPEDATKMGIPEEKRKWFVRMDDAKQNMSPPADSATWYERVSVRLANGDSVGTLAPADTDKYLQVKREADTEEQRAEGEVRVRKNREKRMDELRKSHELIQAMAEMMGPNQRWTLKMSANKVPDEFPHVCENTWRTREAIEKKVKRYAKGDGLVFDGVCFRYVYDKGKRMTGTHPNLQNNRSHHWVETFETSRPDSEIHIPDDMYKEVYEP